MSKQSFGTYPYLYVSRGIGKDDILAFIGIRIYMGLHKYTTIEDYWNNDILYKNILKKIMPKNYYFLLSKVLHFPEKDEKDKSDISSESGTAIKDKYVSERELALVHFIKKSFIIYNAINIMIRMNP